LQLVIVCGHVGAQKLSNNKIRLVGENVVMHKDFKNLLNANVNLKYF